MNVNLYMDEDYKLQACASPKDFMGWTFRAVVFGMPVMSEKIYKSKEGALNAGRKWIQRHMHDEIL